jgi:hypothetical protein
MKRTLSMYEIIDDLVEISGFSYAGAAAFAEHMEEWEFCTGKELEFDPIAFRCEFDEYEDFEEIQGVYPHIKNMEDLRDYTEVIEFDGGLIIGAF